MGEGLFRGCCAPEGVGMAAAWRSRHMVDVWFAGTLDAQTCQQIHKRTHGILCEFGCDQESVATSTLGQLGNRRPRPDTGSAPGSARKQNSVSYGLVLRTFPE
jgi:hypothetical protein